MCNKTGTFYLKICITTLIAIIIGIISGIIWHCILTRPTIYFIIEALTAAVVLILIALYLLFRNSRNNQCQSLLKYYIRYQLFGAIGSFILSVIGLSITITANVISSVIIGTAVAFFVIMISSSILKTDYLLNNNSQN